MKNLITYCAIILCISMMLLGCYSQKRASRQLLKVQTHYPIVVAQLCSNLYPPVTFTKDSVVYLKGDVEEEIVYVEVDCVSLQKVFHTADKVKVPCPPSVYRTDTLLVYKEKQIIDKAAIKVLQAELEQLNADYSKSKQNNYILLRIAIVLGVYTLLRWVLRIWHIKLP